MVMMSLRFSAGKHPNKLLAPFGATVESQHF